MLKKVEKSEKWKFVVRLGMETISPSVIHSDCLTFSIQDEFTHLDPFCYALSLKMYIICFV